MRSAETIIKKMQNSQCESLHETKNISLKLKPKTAQQKFLD